MLNSKTVVEHREPGHIARLKRGFRALDGTLAHFNNLAQQALMLRRRWCETQHAL